jgi:hypothetical protein
MKFIKSFDYEKDALDYVHNNQGDYSIVLSNKYEVYLYED